MVLLPTSLLVFSQNTNAQGANAPTAIAAKIPATAPVTLQRRDRLMFMTDGVVEATNPARELFGFERARAISGQHAAAIVKQAQTFGQEDDITVLRVEFAAA